MKILTGKQQRALYRKGLLSYIWLELAALAFVEEVNFLELCLCAEENRDFMKNANEKKKQIEEEIAKKINSFTEETGIPVHYIDIIKEKNVGFKVEKSDYKAKIIFKND